MGPTRCMVEQHARLARLRAGSDAGRSIENRCNAAGAGVL
jgi:hypothetical protein